MFCLFIVHKLRFDNEKYNHIILFLPHQCNHPLTKIKKYYSIYILNIKRHLKKNVADRVMF